MYHKNQFPIRIFSFSGYVIVLKNLNSLKLYISVKIVYKIFITKYNQNSDVTLCTETENNLNIEPYRTGKITLAYNFKKLLSILVIITMAFL